MKVAEIRRQDLDAVQTQSEIWFEEYCAQSLLSCKRITEQNTKTPDYELQIDGQRIIVEVKEITRNPEERASDRLLAERGYGAGLSNTPGDRVRKKIKDSSPQIKARTQDTYPSLLVLCDLSNGCGQITGHLDPYNVRVAMYGLEQMHIAVPREPSASPYVTGLSYGPKRQMTQDHNTSISAIGVLFTPASTEIKLHVYHNKYAAVPLDRALLAKCGIHSYELTSELLGNTAKWKEVPRDASMEGNL